MFADFLDQDAALRRMILDVFRARLAGCRVPGGDVAVWLAEIPTICLAPFIESGAPALMRRLLPLVGRLRRAHEREALLYDFECDLTHVVVHPRAQAAVKAWAKAQLDLRGEAVA